jgi:hypothetical protein
MAPWTKYVPAKNGKDSSKVIQLTAAGITLIGSRKKYLADQAPALTRVGLPACGTAWVRASKKHLM